MNQKKSLNTKVYELVIKSSVVANQMMASFTANELIVTKNVRVGRLLSDTTIQLTARTNHSDVIIPIAAKSLFANPFLTLISRPIPERNAMPVIGLNVDIGA